MMNEPRHRARWSLSPRRPKIPGRSGMRTLAAAACWLAVLTTPGRAVGADGPPTGTPDTGVKAPAASQSLAGHLEIQVSPAGVSVYAVSADAQKLLITLADRTGLQIIVDDTVRRQITVNLNDLKPEKALEAIVDASGLSSSLIKGVWMISEGIPSGPSSYLLSNIASIRARYVDASAAKSLLPVFLQDYVKIDPDQNSVVLSAPAPVLDKFRTDISQFDIPATQILFDVLMIEISDQHLDQLNLGLAGVDPANPLPNLNWANAGKGLSLAAGAGDLTYQGIGTLPNDFMIQLQALKQKGFARIRANPRIATVSGQPASIFIGTQRYISTPVSNEGNYISAGVNLSITPLTGATGVIFTTLQTEVSVLGADDPVTHLPDKSTRQANTVVTLRDGQTLAIGGLAQDEIHESRTKIPVLGDIPLLGDLFRTHSVEHDKTHLLILITPHVLADTGQPARE